MRPTTVAAFAAAGMIATSVPTYFLTPPANAATVAIARVGSAVTEVAGTVADEVDFARFESGDTLRMEGRAEVRAVLSGDTYESHILLRVTGGPRAPDAASMARSVGLVIDRSGSMRGERLDNAVRAAKMLVEGLAEGDAISVVAFDTGTDVVVPRTVLDPSSRAATLAKLDTVRAGADTCISCGLQRALDLLASDRDRIRRIVVLSDGAANEGVATVEGFRELGRGAQAADVAISSIGLGLEYDEKFLVAMSEQSNGMHHFAPDSSALPAVFQAESEQLGHTVAASAVLTIEPAEGMELVELVDRPHTRRGATVEVPLGSFAEGEEKTVLVRVRGRGTPEGVVPIASAALSFVGGGASEAPVVGRLAVRATTDRSRVLDVDPVVTGRVERSRTSSTLELANDLLEQGRLADAKEALAKQADSVSRRGGGGKASFSCHPGDPLCGDLSGADFEKQRSTLEEARKRLDLGAIDTADPFSSDEGRGAVRSGAEDALQLRR